MAENTTQTKATNPADERNMVVTNSVDHVHRQAGSQAEASTSGAGSESLLRGLQKRPSIEQTLGNMPMSQPNSQKPKKGGFQIIRVISKAGLSDHHNEDGDSLGEDLDETNTEDISSDIMDVSKTADIDPDPSSEDTVHSLSLATDDGQKESGTKSNLPASSTGIDIKSPHVRVTHSPSTGINIPQDQQNFQPLQQPVLQHAASVPQQQDLFQQPKQVNQSQTAPSIQLSTQLPIDPVKTFQPIQKPIPVSKEASPPVDMSPIPEKNSISSAKQSSSPSLQNQQVSSSNIDDTEFGLRFQIVRVQNERYARGRWTCYDYMDSVKSSVNDKSNDQDHGSGNSSAASSVHYIPGVDDASKNPFTASNVNHEGIGTSVSKTSGSMTAVPIPTDSGLVVVQNSSTGAESQNTAGQSSQQTLPSQQPSSMLPQQVPSSQSTAHLQSHLAAVGLAPTTQNQQELSSTAPANGSPVQPVDPSNTATTTGLDPSQHPQLVSHGGINVSRQTSSPSNDNTQNSETPTFQGTGIGAGRNVMRLDPDGSTHMLKTHHSQAGLTPPLLEMVQHMGQSMQYVTPGTKEEEDGASTVAIDNKIEQAMDLVKSHLMFAVREEVEVLKEQIKELLEKNNQLEYENSILKAAATPETLTQLQQSQQQPPAAANS